MALQLFTAIVHCIQHHNRSITTLDIGHTKFTTEVVKELSELLLMNRAINALLSLECGVDNPAPLIGLLKRIFTCETGLSIVLPPGDLEVWQQPPDFI
jgi:hypothetical protein